MGDNPGFRIVSIKETGIDTTELGLEAGDPAPILPGHVNESGLMRDIPAIEGSGLLSDLLGGAYGFNMPAEFVDPEPYEDEPHGESGQVDRLRAKIAANKEELDRKWAEAWLYGSWAPYSDPEKAEALRAKMAEQTSAHTIPSAQPLEHPENIHGFISSGYWDRYKAIVDSGRRPPENGDSGPPVGDLGR